MSALDYSAIKRKVESKLCPLHNQYPKFSKTTTGFEITACCSRFKGDLEKIVSDETEKSVHNMLKNIFKK